MLRLGTRDIGVVGSSLLSTVLLVSALVSVTACGATSAEPRSTAKSKARVAEEKTSEKASVRESGRDGSDVRSVGFVAAALGATAADEARETCRQGMVAIEGRYCIDRYEASLVEVLPNGEERAFSPFATVADHHVRAVSEANVTPQGYISRNQAERACVASGKRLCKVSEWQQACRGPENKQYGYGDQREVGRCNDNGKNPVVRLFGFRYDATTMNRPQLNQLDGTLAKTGERSSCSNGYGVYDMVGNLHEWVADPNGTFYGGYYQDVSSMGHGEGCGYLTTAHEARYHDYSTGFRCCADIGSGEGSLVSMSAPPPPPTVSSSSSTLGGARGKAPRAPKPMKPKSQKRRK